MADQPNEFQTMFLKAMYESLTAEVREKLIKDGIAHAMKSPAYNQMSPLQAAVHDGVQAKCRDIVHDMAENDEKFQAACKEIVDRLVNEVLHAGRDKLVGALTDAFWKVLRGY